MKTNDRCGISRDGNTITIEFHRMHLESIRDTIRSSFPDDFPVEWLPGDIGRITIVADKDHPAEEVGWFADNFIERVRLEGDPPPPEHTRL